ncbi:MAG: alpha/beta hydrolase [Anaerolineales bacterium]|nr:alpha/beta hydrolase [Anaerolineales bacterium]
MRPHSSKFVAFVARILFVLFGLMLVSAARPPAGLRTPDTAALLADLGGIPCPDDSAFTCVTLTVPLDHLHPANGQTLDVIFGVLPATGERQGMFVTATGGPGTAGLAYADSYTSAFDPALPEHFDIVFFDQRGVGQSGGLTCPNAAAVFYQSDARGLTPEQEAATAAAAQTFAEDCVAEVSDPGLLPYLGTEQAVEDLELFRQAMQVEQFWLYGESYGTQYAQTYARAHGSRLAGLILDGTVDLTLTGFEYYAQQAQAFGDTLAATLAACAQDPACRADLGRRPELVYDRLARRLANGPLTFRFPRPGAVADRRSFTLADLEVVAAGQMYTPGDRLLFTRALAAYGSRNDLVPLARLLYVNLGLDPLTLDVIPDPTWSEAIYYGVECQDYGYPGSTPEQRALNYLRAGDDVEGALPRLGSLFYGDLPCAYWPNPQYSGVATTVLTRPAPLRAEGVPTIVLGATADPATPVGNGLSVYQALDNAYLVTQQGGPHVIFGRGEPCQDDLVTNFLLFGETPASRETECPGVVMDAYVPLAPRSVRLLAGLPEAFLALEDELSYLPEFYYWDGVEAAGVGCGRGGTLTLVPDDEVYAFTMESCALLRDLTLTGSGSQDPATATTTWDVTTSGRWACELHAERTETHLTITGDCGTQTIAIQTDL